MAGDRVNPGVDHDGHTRRCGGRPDLSQIGGMGVGVEEARAGGVIGVLDVAPYSARVDKRVSRLVEPRKRCAATLSSFMSMLIS